MMELGKFKVHEELGHGGCGKVYRDYDTTLEKATGMGVKKTMISNLQLLIHLEVNI